jgi:molybdopterin synthase catalytic subunit
VSACEILLTRAKLTPPDNDVDLASGAVVDFRGVVRALENDRQILGIDYEAHADMAEHQMQLLAERATAQFRLTNVILHHRVGFVAAGEPSLFLRVCSAHRAAAFEGSKWMVDELKRVVPIWKHVRYKIDIDESARQTESITT